MVQDYAKHQQSPKRNKNWLIVVIAIVIMLSVLALLFDKFRVVKNHAIVQSKSQQIKQQKLRQQIAEARARVKAKLANTTPLKKKA